MVQYTYEGNKGGNQGDTGSVKPNQFYGTERDGDIDENKQIDYGRDGQSTQNLLERDKPNQGDNM